MRSSLPHEVHVLPIFPTRFAVLAVKKHSITHWNLDVPMECQPIALFVTREWVCPDKLWKPCVVFVSGNCRVRVAGGRFLSNPSCRSRKKMLARLAFSFGKLVGIQNSDERQVSIFIVVIQAVTNHELIRDFKAAIIRLDGVLLTP